MSLYVFQHSMSTLGWTNQVCIAIAWTSFKGKLHAAVSIQGLNHAQPAVGPTLVKLGFSV